MPAPLISIIIPAYNSHETIPNSLNALHEQTLTDYEIIVVDSGHSDESERIITVRFPHVRYFRSTARLYPHEARNYGVQRAQGSLLVFTDPDCYPKRDWLEQMWNAHQLTGHTIVSAVACYGSAWKDQGIHFSKFDKWLPGGSPRPIDLGPTTGIFCPLDRFQEVGGFPNHRMLADTSFSWNLRERGYTLWFLPTAVTEHHHLHDLAGLVRERFERGREFGHLRVDEGQWNRPRILFWLLVSLIPVRLAKLLWRGISNASCAKQTGDYLLTIPITALAQWAWLLGECRAYTERLLRPS